VISPSRAHHLSSQQSSADTADQHLKNHKQSCKTTKQIFKNQRLSLKNHKVRNSTLANPPSGYKQQIQPLAIFVITFQKRSDREITEYATTSPESGAILPK